MEKYKIFQKWNTQTVVGVAIGAALYAVLMNYGGIRVFTNTSLTTAMIVPVIVGGLFGPLPAAVACGLGNILADLIGAWGFWFDWSIGNAVMGFFVGLLPVYGARVEDGIFTGKQKWLYVLWVVVGNIIGIGIVTPLITMAFYSGEMAVTFAQAWAAIPSNFIIQLVVGIPLLVGLAKRNASHQNLSKE